jgi:hypothetical protein
MSSVLANPRQHHLLQGALWAISPNTSGLNLRLPTSLRHFSRTDPFKIVWNRRHAITVSVPVQGQNCRMAGQVFKAASPVPLLAEGRQCGRSVFYEAARPLHLWPLQELFRQVLNEL